MQILTQPIEKTSLLHSENLIDAADGLMVKGVVDVERELLALDSELHADLEQALLADGSQQDHLWGINLYPEQSGDNFIEFDSMINIRPRQNNRSRSVEDPAIRAKIIAVVNKWLR